MTRLLFLPDDATIIQMEVSIPPRQLTNAINAGGMPVQILMDSGDALTASQIGQTVIVSPKRKRGRPARAKRMQDALTRRQRQVLELASHGYTTTQIAALMDISRRTVSYHLKGIKTQIAVTPQSLIAEDPALLNFDPKLD
ncbi:MAG: LuxR C-terminal-related transcriptional regulator [Anaerolineaceae bacterium]|nr:LuxR C-terminal-related transcriptional regulator [Anaerolineaceae bacterium]